MNFGQDIIITTQSECQTVPFYSIVIHTTGEQV